MTAILTSSGHRAIPWTIRGLASVVFIAASIVAGPAAAEPPDAFDQRIAAELEALSPEAARTFEQANQARDRQDWEGARALYEDVRKLAPSFDHATRRLCSVEASLGRHPQALAHCREALAAARTSQNLSSLALTLARASSTPADLQEANHLSAEAVALAPDDKHVRRADCQLALASEDVPRLRACVSRLHIIAPDDSATDVFDAFLAMLEQRRDDAYESLGKARSHGLPQEEHARLTDLFDRSVAWPVRVWNVAWRVGVGWLAAFAALLFAGWLLSRAALRSASRVPTSSAGRPQGSEKNLRRVYRGVLWLCCAFYYLSLPMVLLLVVGAGGGIILGILMLGVIPIKLLVIVGIVVVSTASAMLKGLFVRARNEEPGARLDLAAHPRFQAALVEVAAKIGTDPVEIVYLTPGTDIAVMERGEIRGLLRGRGKRCLILGAGVLKGMKVVELKSILAHEHGHLHNEDTAGGGFALAVRRSLITMAIALAHAGAAAWYNPAWLFLRAFDRVFLVISQGASRLQEVLADRWAVHAYGSEAFVSGLTHVITRSVRFKAHVNATLAEVVKEEVGLLNLYSYKPAEKAEVEDEIDEAIDAEPSPYDSHPSPKDRIAAARALAEPARSDEPEDQKLAWSLFSERKQLEEQMTDEVRDRVFETHRVKIPRKQTKKKATSEESASAE